MEFGKEATVRDFLKEIGLKGILEGDEIPKKYRVNFELFKAMAETFKILTESTSNNVPDYKLVLMFVVPKKRDIEKWEQEMTFYYKLSSNNSNRKYDLNKSIVKNIEDYANATIVLSDESGSFALSYTEQAAILLFSFCALDEGVIEAYSDGEEITPLQLISDIRELEDNDE